MSKRSPTKKSYVRDLSLFNKLSINSGKDAFPSLAPQKKWHTDPRHVQPDDIVIVAENNAIRGKWSNGRIVEVFPGPDGRV